MREITLVPVSEASDQFTATHGSPRTSQAVRSISQSTVATANTDSFLPPKYSHNPGYARPNLFGHGLVTVIYSWKYLHNSPIFPSVHKRLIIWHTRVCLEFDLRFHLVTKEKSTRISRTPSSKIFQSTSKYLPWPFRCYFEGKLSKLSKSPILLSIWRIYEFQRSKDEQKFDFDLCQWLDFIRRIHDDDGSYPCNDTHLSWHDSNWKRDISNY